MNPVPRLLAITLALCAAGGALAAAADASQAAGRCESEVADTIKRMRGKDVAGVQFTAARAHAVAHGRRRDRRARRGPLPARRQQRRLRLQLLVQRRHRRHFGRRVPRRRTHRSGGATAATWQPDLTHVSPEACESAVAAVLKDRHPRVGRIVFGSESRRLQPAANARIGLQGKGAVQPAPGMNALPFDYRCEIDPRNGRVLQAQASE